MKTRGEARGARALAVADAALTVLAERGMRGLTHRAVDEEAGLPAGSTSNVARTRRSLLETAVARLAEREAEVLAPGADVATGPDAGRAELCEYLAHALHVYLQDHGPLLVARYELALEATRRPELREVYDTAGQRFDTLATELLRGAGSADPERHARTMVAWCDGTLFAHLAGSFSARRPTYDDLHRGLGELLDGMLGTGQGGRP